ncbi:MAG: hypothetical protein R3F19_19535 [Verrucomicrobiales bacterium]
MHALSYGALLWQLFRAIIEGTLDALKAKLEGKSLTVLWLPSTKKSTRSSAGRYKSIRI